MIFNLMRLKPQVQPEPEPHVKLQFQAVPSSLPQVQQLVVQAAVEHLFSKAYFDVCIVSDLIKVMGGQQGRAYELLRTVHCVHYDKMPTELKKQLPYLVRECLEPNEQQTYMLEAFPEFRQHV